MLNLRIHVFVVFCTMGITFLALGGTVTAEEK